MTTHVSLRLTPGDRERIERIRDQMADRNTEWAKQGISDGAVLRHCLECCDPERRA